MNIVPCYVVLNPCVTIAEVQHPSFGCDFETKAVSIAYNTCSFSITKQTVPFGIRVGIERVKDVSCWQPKKKIM